jgi:hypothetical protein
MTWEIEIKPQAEQWFMSLGAKDAHQVAAALDRLGQVGPTLGTPSVKAIKGSRHHNMKELRYGNHRALFAFDPKRRAVVLLGGDKTGEWQKWYERNIPVADRLYEQHLRSRGGGGKRWQTVRAGTRSAASER